MNCIIQFNLSFFLQQIADTLTFRGYYYTSVKIILTQIQTLQLEKKIRKKEKKKKGKNWHWISHNIRKFAKTVDFQRIQYLRRNIPLYLVDVTTNFFIFYFFSQLFLLLFENMEKWENANCTGFCEFNDV